MAIQKTPIKTAARPPVVTTKKAARPAIVVGPTMAPILSSVVPGVPGYAGVNGRSLPSLLEAAMEPRPVDTDTGSIADLLASLNVTPIAPTPTAKEPGGVSFAIDPQPNTDANTAYAANTGIDTGNTGNTSFLPPYVPQYQPLPSRPELVSPVAPPIRDTKAERQQRESAQQLAALVPLLALATGGSGVAFDAARGAAPSLLARAMQGADAGADSRWKDSLDAYTLDSGYVTAKNRQTLDTYADDVRRTDAANDLETQRATTSRQNRDAEARAAAVAERAKAKVDQAAKPKPEAITRERNGILTTLEGMDAKSQQHVLAMLDESGDAARLGIPTTKDANGRYTFSVRKQRPAGEQSVQERVRIARLTHDKGQVETDLRNPRLLAKDRPALEARWKQLDKALGGPGMKPPRFEAFTPAEKATMDRQDQRDRERRAREAKQDARQAATAAGKMNPYTRLRRADLVREANDLQSLILNTRVSLAARKKYAARLREIRVNTGIGTKVPLNPEDVSGLTPGQVMTQKRFESTEYNKKSKGVKILSVTPYDPETDGDAE